MQVLFNDNAKFEEAATHIAKAIKIESNRLVNKPHILGIISEKDIDI